MVTQRMYTHTHTRTHIHSACIHTHVSDMYRYSSQFEITSVDCGSGHTEGQGLS